MWKNVTDGIPSFYIKTEELCKVVKTSGFSGVFMQQRELVGAATHLIYFQKKANFSQRKVSTWFGIDNNHQGVKAGSSMSLMRPLGGKVPLGCGDTLQKTWEKLSYLFAYFSAL